MAQPDFRRIRAIVFDLDGTLIDSYEAIAESLGVAMKDAGLAPLSTEEVRGMVGMGLETLIAKVMGEARVEEGVKAFRVHYDRICVAKTSLMPEVAGTLAELHRRGYRMSVATNKPSYFAWRLLEGLLVRRYLTTVLGPDLVQNRKPHPEMVIKAMAKMTVTARESLYVGDMEIDVETARRAGIPVAVVPTGSRTAEALRASGADLLLGSFRELLEYLPGVSVSPRPGPTSP